MPAQPIQNRLGITPGQFLSSLSLLLEPIPMSRLGFACEIEGRVEIDQRSVEMSGFFMEPGGLDELVD